MRAIVCRHGTPVWRGAVAAGMVLVLVLSGCAGANAGHPLRGHLVAGGGLTQGTPPPALLTPAPIAAAPATPTPASTARPTKSPAPHHAAATKSAQSARAAAAGEPDPTLTPGATNPAVTQATIRATICVSGWTATVRPPSSYTTSLKRSQIAAYGYRDRDLSDYEEDHLIPLEVGGAPSDPRNLWPEPYGVSLADGTAVGARVKDQLENKLHALVCGGSMSLATAQRLIRSDWIDAWRTYVAGGAGATTPRSPTPAPVGGVVSPPPGGTSLRVTITSLTSPVSRGATASLAATTAPSAACTITVLYKSGPSKAAGLGPKNASSAGRVSWSWAVGSRTASGSWPVTVTCTKGSGRASATRSFVVT